MVKQIISIHALLAESDAGVQLICSRYKISIHALLAESDGVFMAIYFGRKFLSTLSLRRATLGNGYRGREQGISIHALLAESDSKSAQNSGALLRI